MSAFLLQNAIVLLQSATVFTNYGDFITKYESYYKMQRLLQIATVLLNKDLILIQYSQVVMKWY